MPVKIGDDTIRNIPEQVSENLADIIDLKNKLTLLQIRVDGCLRKASIVNNLASTAVDRPLSANMGRELNEKINAAMAGVYKPKGSLTVAQINALDTSELESGYVYNVLDSGTITLESIHVNAGDNVVWIIEGGVGKWDPLAGTIDVSDLASLTADQTFEGKNTFKRGIYIRDYYATVAANIKYEYANNSLYINNPSESPEYRIGLGGATPESKAFIPAADDSRSLGTSSYRWKDLHLSGNEYLGATKLYTDNTKLFINLNNDSSDDYAFYAAAFVGVGGQKNLGTASNKWNDLNLAGKILFDTNIAIYKDASNGILFQNGSGNYPLQVYSNAIYISKPITPTTTGVNLGGSNNRLSTVFSNNINVSNDITDGTNTVIVADLKALIDYAKAQGWIS